MNSLTAEMKLVIVVGVIIAVSALMFMYRQFPKRLKADKFSLQWKNLQRYCKDKSTWADALITADTLLDQALKKRKFKGGSMGERMVSAQRYFTNNDDLWFAHNLCKKLRADSEIKLKEVDVKDALVGFRQGLRDLGALKNAESKD